MLHDPHKDAVIAEELFHAGLQPWHLELLAAAEKLKRDGWCRHELGEVEGPNCALGSLWAARGSLEDALSETISQTDSNWIHAQAMRIEHYLDMESKFPELSHPDIAYWNDEVAMSVDDVVRVFQYVALG